MIFQSPTKKTMEIKRTDNRKCRNMTESNTNSLKIVTQEHITHLEWDLIDDHENLHGISFRGANLTKTKFIRCKMDYTCFHSAFCRSSVFLDCKLDAALRYSPKMTPLC